MSLIRSHRKSMEEVTEEGTLPDTIVSERGSEETLPDRLLKEQWTEW